MIPAPASPAAPDLDPDDDSLYEPLIPPAQFKPCLCLGVMQGRACQWCFNTRWLKRCQACMGAGKTYQPGRTIGSQIQVAPCGFCMGKGWLAAKPADKAEIRALQAGVGQVRAAAESKLAQQVQQVPGDSTPGPRPAKPKPGKRRPVAATKRRGRQPSAGSLAKLAERTGGEMETYSTSLGEPGFFAQAAESESQMTHISPAAAVSE